VLIRSQRAGSYVVDWGIELEAQTKAWELENHSAAPAAPAAPAKRVAAGNAELPERGHKKIKTVDDDDGMSDEAMKKTFDKNQVEKLTVPILRAWLQSKGLSVSGKKADLVERVEAFFERK